jgi:hypothetical protein
MQCCMCLHIFVNIDILCNSFPTLLQVFIHCKCLLFMATYLSVYVTIPVWMFFQNELCAATQSLSQHLRDFEIQVSNMAVRFHIDLIGTDPEVYYIVLHQRTVLCKPFSVPFSFQSFHANRSPFRSLFQSFHANRSPFRPKHSPIRNSLSQSL